jgi:hypothetical protein
MFIFARYGLFLGFVDALVLNFGGLFQRLVLSQGGVRRQFSSGVSLGLHLK